MYYKARVFGDMESARMILDCNQARDMKRIGSHIRLFDTEKWRKVSVLVRKLFLIIKNRFIFFKGYDNWEYGQICAESIAQEISI